MKIIIFVLLLAILFSEIAIAQTENINIDLTENKTYVRQIESGQYIFSFSYKADVNKDIELEVILPPESVVIDREGLLISRPVDISTDGKRIFLYWKKSLNSGEEFSAFVQYQDKSTGISSFYLIFIAVLVGAAGVFAGYRLKIFKKDKFIEEVVSEDENKIVAEIKKKGEIFQEDLRDSLGWSKTKISKVVRKLESKNVIVKTPYRKTNKLKIK